MLDGVTAFRRASSVAGGAVTFPIETAASREGRDQAWCSVSDPPIQVSLEFPADHVVEAIDECSCLDKCWNCCLNGGDSDGISIAQMIARRGHPQCDGSGSKRSLARASIFARASASFCKRFSRRAHSQRENQCKGHSHSYQAPLLFHRRRRHAAAAKACPEPCDIYFSAVR